MPRAVREERPATRVWRALALESLWAVAAVALALAVALHLAGSEGRGEMMFRDGDSMVVPLFSRSILEGTASDWAMSAVLFVPEIIVFVLLSLTGLGIHEAQFVSAVLNFFGLYLVFRAGAVAVSRGNRAPAAALLGFIAVCALAFTEGDGDRSSMQLASLLAMTTYYAATVLGALLAVGLARRIIERATPPRLLITAIAVVVSVSVFSNPLYIAWVTAPLIAIVAVVAIRAGTPSRQSSVWAILAIAGGSAIGYALRLPLTPWIVANPENYFQPRRAGESLAYYSSLLNERISAPSGIVAVVIIVALSVLGVVLTVRSLRVGATGAAVVAAYSWFAPASTTIGFILLGTEAARYLQLWAFAPALALIVLMTDAVPLSPVAVPWRNRVALAAIPAVVGASLIVVLLPQATERATATDSSLQCAVNWVNNSGAMGAGQFWSVRTVKTHLDDPAQLIQVDHLMNGYSWLVDRGDFAQDTVSFVVTDSQSVPITLPSGYDTLRPTTIDCGRFQIDDYSPAKIPVGPARP